MTHNQITSLQSPHVERVKALLGSRAKKIRQSEREFLADGIQSVREALNPSYDDAPKIIYLYVTERGFSKLQEEISKPILETVPLIHVSDQVMDAMSETQSPQGILALCKFTEMTLYKLSQRGARKIAYFWEIQDPGNSGTVIRTGESCGFDGIVFSPNSVDAYSPKTIRATVGAIWHIPVVEGVPIENILDFAKQNGFTSIALAGDAAESILDVGKHDKTLIIFGNEARGLPEIPNLDLRVKIPMQGKSESLNVASAAAITMFELGIR